MNIYEIKLNGLIPIWEFFDPLVQILQNIPFPTEAVKLLHYFSLFAPKDVKTKAVTAS